jgi:hypothetical protein
VSRRAFAAGAYGELSSSSQNPSRDVVLGGGLSGAYLGNSLGMTASLGAYARKSTTWGTEGGAATSLLVGLRDPHLPAHVPIGVRAEYRLGWSESRERAFIVSLQIDLVMLATGLGVFFAYPPN